MLRRSRWNQTRVSKRASLLAKVAELHGATDCLFSVGGASWPELASSAMIAIWSVPEAGCA